MASYGCTSSQPLCAAPIDETARVLRPSGRLIVVDLDVPPRHSRLFDISMRVVEKPHAREVVMDGLIRGGVGGPRHQCAALPRR
jgi:hypothetical protein